MASNHNISDQIDDLTQSLHRTTDVLSTADRMIDHYKDLNREQEHEIAKLNDDLYQMSRQQQNVYESKLLKTLNDTLKKRHQDSLSESSSDERPSRSRSNRRKRKMTPGKVRFKKEFSPDHDENLRTSLDDITRRQELLEHEVRKNHSLRTTHIDPLNTTYKQLAASHEDDFSREKINLTNKLKELQDKIDEDQWRRQQSEMKLFTDEMQSLKNIVKEAITPKPTERSSRFDLSDNSEQKLKLYKRRLQKEEDTVSLLKEEVKAKEKEKLIFEAKVDEIESLGKMKSNQLKLLEDQLLLEKTEKQNLMKELNEAQKKVDRSEKEYSQLLLHMSEIKVDSQSNQMAYEKSMQTIPELKRLLEKSERYRDKYSGHVHELESELQLKENMVLRLTNQLNELSSKTKFLESELQKYVHLSEERSKESVNAKAEIENTKAALYAAEQRFEQCEKSRQDLKEKAVQTVKEYKLKCRQYEKQITENVKLQKEKDLELSKEMSRARDMEIFKLKLQKELQENVYEIDQLKQDLSECESTISQVTQEKSHLENVLSTANVEIKEMTLLKNEIQDLKTQKLSLNTQLFDEKRRRKELESLLHENYEKTLSNKDTSSSLQRQLMEERTNHVQAIAKLKEETLQTKQLDVCLLKEKNTKLEEEKSCLENKLKYLENSGEELRLKLSDKDREVEYSSTRNQELVEKLRKLAEDNKKFRKQYQLQQGDESERMKALNETIRQEKYENSILQKQLSECQQDGDMMKDAVKIFLNISTRDVDNLVNLLTEEEENVLPIKEIPDTLLSDHRNSLVCLRGKLETCYSIAKTLKKRFQQQKALIRKAQLKIKSQSHDIEELKKSRDHKSEQLKQSIQRNEKYVEQEKRSLEDKESQIKILQSRVTELSKRLEQCTRALHKSIDANKERKDVLNELDLLKYEHAEKNKIDEDFFRNSEKLDVLSERLTEAKNSLDQVKLETMDTTVFTNRMIETFGSVSPARKRKLFSLQSPRLKSTAKVLFEKDRTNASTLDLSQTPGKRSNERLSNPMSMTDEEFLENFLSDSPQYKGNLKTPDKAYHTKDNVDC